MTTLAYCRACIGNGAEAFEPGPHGVCPVCGSSNVYPLDREAYAAGRDGILELVRKIKPRREGDRG